MALAIAVHNIPEGVIVAAPVFAATGSRCKACGLALASVGWAKVCPCTCVFGAAQFYGNFS